MSKLNISLGLNNRGAALILGYVVLFALVALSSSVSMFNFTELANAKRHRDSVTAFWLAESGIQEFLSNPSVLDKIETKTFDLGRGTVYLTKNDSSVTKRVVTSTGKVNEIQRSIEIEYPAAPSVFDHTMSIKGNLSIQGKKSTVAINDKLRVSGSVKDSSKYSSVFIEDKGEGINPSTVSLMYPDVDNNGQSDEFNDFVLFNRQLIKNYTQEEVVYLRGNGNYTITPDESYQGKKIVFIDAEEGKGNVRIQFNGAWGAGQNLTIISTGIVTNNLSGKMASDSQLNIIAWQGYKETAILPSSHKGIVFTHGKATFDEMHDTSITNGSVVANDGIEIKEVWSTKTFNYVDTRVNGFVPPGFEGLIGGGVSEFSKTPNVWREVSI